MLAQPVDRLLRGVRPRSEHIDPSRKGAPARLSSVRLGRYPSRDQDKRPEPSIEDTHLCDARLVPELNAQQSGFPDGYGAIAEEDGIMVLRARSAAGPLMSPERHFLLIRRPRRKRKWP